MFTTTLVKLGTRPAARKCERATHTPIDVQLHRLFSILKRNRDTAYGRRYGFASIRSVADYQRRLPVITYEDIRLDVERMAAGEPNILTTERPLMFARTSGTTGYPKLIPITESCRRSERIDFARTWVHHVLKAHAEVYNTQVVSLISPAVEGYTPGGIPYGSVSGSIYKNMPAVVRRHYAVPYEVFSIRDYQAKYYAITRLTLEQSIAMICTANPSSILKMCEKADEFGDDIIRDIHDGTLARRVAIEPSIRAAIEKRLRPNKQRAAFLEWARRRRDGVLKPVDYWPRLSLIGCWKGGTVGHYLEKLPQWLDPDGCRPIPIRDWGYISSEARCSIPVSDHGSAGILALTINFYEFVPVSDVLANPENPAAWTFFTADQLEDGREYHIILTTTGGLYRYNINDIIRVEGFYNLTPQITFVRKGQGMTNLTGEKLSVDQVIEAVSDAGRQIGALPTHFKAEADAEESRYILRVEFQEQLSKERGRRFLTSVDEYLKHVNIEYKAKRESMRLGPPVLHIMSEGWYEHNQRRLVAQGAPAFQTKAELLTMAAQRPADAEAQPERIIELSSTPAGRR